MQFFRQRTSNIDYRDSSSYFYWTEDSYEYGDLASFQSPHPRPRSPCAHLRVGRRVPPDTPAGWNGRAGRTDLRGLPFRIFAPWQGTNHRNGFTLSTDSSHREDIFRTSSLSTPIISRPPSRNFAANCRHPIATLSCWRFDLWIRKNMRWMQWLSCRIIFT